MTALFIYEPIDVLDLVLPSLELEALPLNQLASLVTAELSDLATSAETLISTLTAQAGGNSVDVPRNLTVSPFSPRFRHLCS